MSVGVTAGPGYTTAARSRPAPAPRHAIPAPAPTSATTPAQLPVPWCAEQLVRLVAMDLVAVVLLGIAWYGASGELELTGQIRSLDLAVLALLVMAVAHTGWLLAGRRAVGLRSRQLADRMTLAMGPALAVGADEDVPALALSLSPTLTSGFVRAPGMARLHLVTCPLVIGKHIEAVPAVEAANGVACGVCRP